MEYFHHIDLDALKSSGTNGAAVERLISGDANSGGYEVACITTPTGGGSREGLHTHSFDQQYFVLAGVMNVEIDGKEYTAGPGTFIKFPANVPHRNWNTKPEPTVHLTLFKRSSNPNEPLATPVRK
jgi:quercetin dioxygenase-like cupin family protein